MHVFSAEKTFIHLAYFSKWLLLQGKNRLDGSKIPPNHGRRLFGGPLCCMSSRMLRFLPIIVGALGRAKQSTVFIYRLDCVAINFNFCKFKPQRVLVYTNASIPFSLSNPSSCHVTVSWIACMGGGGFSLMNAKALFLWTSLPGSMNPSRTSVYVLLTICDFLLMSHHASWIFPISSKPDWALFFTFAPFREGRWESFCIQNGFPFTGKNWVSSSCKTLSDQLRTLEKRLICRMATWRWQTCHARNY